MALKISERGGRRQKVSTGYRGRTSVLGFLGLAADVTVC
jgi:hypothetical protein